MLEPRLLVLDEPTFGQDRSTSAALVERLHELVAHGTTIILVTHDMRLVANDADHVIMLVHGGVAYAGPPGGLLGDDPHSGQSRREQALPDEMVVEFGIKMGGERRTEVEAKYKLTFKWKRTQE